MRVDKFIPSKSSVDPVTGAGQLMTFVAWYVETTVGRHWDLFYVDGVTYVCHDGNVGIHTSQGVAIVRGNAGRKLHADLSKRFPYVANKPEKAEA